MHLDAGVGRGPCIHLRFGFFFDGCDHDLNPMSARSVQQQKRKSPIAGNQTQLGDRLSIPRRSYLITPRWERSMNATR